MKRIVFLGLILLSAMLAYADSWPNYEFSGLIDPTFRTATSVTQSSSTIPSAGAGLKNCLTDWTLMSTTVSNMSIVDGALNNGTTVWGLVSVPAGTVISKDNIRESALCGSTSTQMNVVVSSGSVSINYRGYIRKTP